MSNINFTYTFSDPGPNTILTSVAYANNGDPNTTNAILPSTVVTISTLAFSTASVKPAMTTINCSNALGLRTIGNRAFDTCSFLNSITGISSVTSMGLKAFNACIRLTSFSWPSGVLAINDEIFGDCRVLTSIGDISSVTSIGQYPFYNSILPSFTWPSAILSIGPFALYSLYAATSITGISSVRSIGTEAFLGCEALTSIDISAVTSIGSGAFVLCGLRSFTWPSGAYSIGDLTFDRCSALTSITNTGSVTSIGSDRVFRSCNALRSFTWPSAVRSISNIFSGLPALTSIGDISSVTSIPSNAFQSCTSLPSFTWPSGAYSIGDNTFNGCLALTSITNTVSVTNIGLQAFRQCSALRSFVVASSVTIVGANAFNSCGSLTSITLQRLLINGLTTLDTNSFLNTTAINSTNYNSLTTMIIQGYPSIDLTNAGFDAAAITLAVEAAAALVCFKEDTKILTDKGYIPIQNLRKGDLVKTLLNDYKPIFMIGKRYMTHIASQERIKDQLYKCSQTEYPEIIEPLIITGCHSILVDNFMSEAQKKKVFEINKDIYVTDDKYRLPAFVDDRASVYEIPGPYTIYHLALENENYYYNYGIYANGLLVETCSKRYLKELSNMILID